MAYVEDASIVAFRTLMAELIHHRAPRALALSAHRSARDEVRHARTTARLARRFGGRPSPAVVRMTPPRSIEALAVDNEVEGCVRETFGAFMATWQAEHAEDLEVKQAMEKIAADETRHAALSWAIARWSNGLLDDAARERVQTARATAIAILREEVLAPTPEELVRVAGMPSAADASKIVDEMERRLWS